MAHNPFLDLEPGICNAADAARTLAYIFEDIQQDEKGGRYTVYESEYSLLAFLVYDLTSRTGALRSAFYAAHEEAQK